MHCRSVVLGALAALAVTPALADVVGYNFRNAGTCFARHYDDPHLRSHPQQRVTAIMLDNSFAQENGEDGSSWDAVLDFGFTLRDGTTYAAVAYCKDDVCSLEGDGGRFSVAAAKDGALRLSIVGGFLEVEGIGGFSGNLAKSDDKVFLVYPARAAACGFV